MSFSAKTQHEHNYYRLMVTSDGCHYSTEQNRTERNIPWHYFPERNDFYCFNRYIYYPSAVPYM